MSEKSPWAFLDVNINTKLVDFLAQNGWLQRFEPLRSLFAIRSLLANTVQRELDCSFAGLVFWHVVGTTLMVACERSRWCRSINTILDRVL